MGQKVHPVGFRLGVIRSWNSNWYEEKNYAHCLKEDDVLRKYVKKACENAGVAKVEIERAANKVKISIHTARPGIVIGRKGAEIDRLKAELGKLTSSEVILHIEEVRKPELDAQLVAETVDRKSVV